MEALVLPCFPVSIFTCHSTLYVRLAYIVDTVMPAKNTGKHILPNSAVLAGLLLQEKGT